MTSQGQATLTSDVLLSRWHHKLAVCMTVTTNKHVLRTVSMRSMYSTMLTLQSWPL